MNLSHHLILFLALLLPGSRIYAQDITEEAVSVRAIVSGIVSYTRWPELSGPPRLCIFSSSRFTSTLANGNDVTLPYQPIIVRTEQEALSTRCDGFYFGRESPAFQVALANAHPSKALLLIAEQNTECILGSAFCLIINNSDVRFSVNLDSLAHSGVKVNPDVLMLARNKKHG